jgi:hypothetical protein
MLLFATVMAIVNKQRVHDVYAASSQQQEHKFTHSGSH